MFILRASTIYSVVVSYTTLQKVLKILYKKKLYLIWKVLENENDNTFESESNSSTTECSIQ
ncbi:hypothetical protein BpHYR1_040524, partial [Brachionus plicatilis]